MVCPVGRDPSGRVTYRQWTFRELDNETHRLAVGLQRIGVRPGARIALMVRPSLEFIALTYALFKAGAVVVLIDPGMGLRNVFRCLKDVKPDGFVAISPVQAVRILSRSFPTARHNVTVGRRWFWGGPTYASLRTEVRAGFEAEPRNPTDPAAILFTSGSTGPAKGVLYEHGMFAAQVDALRDYFQIQPGEVDLPGFPLFALFNAAMGVTTVIPDMDPSRPARVDPVKIVTAIEDQGVTQAFGSPAIWNRVGRYCEQHGKTLPTVRRILSAGAPVPEDVLRRMTNALAPDAEMFTPYGATEALPVSAISAREVLNDTVHKTRAGQGTCVGRPFPSVRVMIIEEESGPIATLGNASEMPCGWIGEILVQSPAVTRAYFNRPQATALSKVADGSTFWHRMGDTGYLDAEGRLWFCGRKAHVVPTRGVKLYTECVEPVFNTLPGVSRTALVGIGADYLKTPVIIVELESGSLPAASESELLVQQLRARAQEFPHTSDIAHFLFHPSLPVDVRHNVKINREELAVWASKELADPT